MFLSNLNKIYNTKIAFQKLIHDVFKKFLDEKCLKDERVKGGRAYQEKECCVKLTLEHTMN